MADFDGDGKPDIASVSYGNILSIFRNISSPGVVSFAPREDIITSPSAFKVAVGDFDGDGRPDIAITNRFDYSLSIFRNISVIGTIGFAPKVNIITGQNPNNLVIRDLNADGKPEIVVANTSPQKVFPPSIP